MEHNAHGVLNISSFFEAFRKELALRVFARVGGRSFSALPGRDKKLNGLQS
jgi:hypothetical protein